MIDESFLKEFATKSRTSFLNVAREYLQHLFLTNFYRQKESENFLFKGGTALKLVFGSPRFSEDVDFTGILNSKIYERLLEKVLEDFYREGIDADLLESKPTSGGHLAILKFRFFGENVEVRNEISFRKEEVKAGEPFIITSEIVPTYTVYLLPKEKLISEKIMTLLVREKPRDFFDLYFIFRKDELRRVIKFKKGQREKILTLLEKQDKKKLERELKALLPIDFWSVIKDLPQAIKKELYI